jgi:hypothetical protein
MHPMESWGDVFEVEGRLFLTGGFEMGLDQLEGTLIVDEPIVVG